MIKSKEKWISSIYIIIHNSHTSEFAQVRGKSNREKQARGWGTTASFFFTIINGMKIQNLTHKRIRVNNINMHVNFQTSGNK